MSFEDLKKAVASYDAVVVDSDAEGAPNVCVEAMNFEGDVFLWRSSRRLKFNNRENKPVLELVNKYSWSVDGDCLIICKNEADLKAILAPPAPPAPEPVIQPVGEPIVVVDPVEEVEEDQDDDDVTPPSRFDSWEEGEE